MPWSCSICTDLFNGIEIISTTKCGHVYHMKCLKKWILESGTCPECRKSVLSSQLVQLYPNEISCKETQNNENYFDLKTELSEKEREIRKLRSQNEELTIYVAKAESEASAHFQEICKLQFQLKSANLQKNLVKSLESKITNLEKINRQLNSENEHLNGVRTIVNGTQLEAEEMLSSYSSNAGEGDAAKKLATYCSILKRELDRVIQEKKLLKLDLLKLKNQYSSTNTNLMQLKQLVEKLKTDISLLEKEKQDLSGCNYSMEVSNRENEKKILVMDHVSENDIDYSPITVKFAENKKKIGVRIMEDEMPSTSKVSIFNNKKVVIPSSLIPAYQDDSITRIGYDGFGGHGSIINRTFKDNLPKHLMGKKTKSTFSGCKLLSPLSKRKRKA